MYMSVSATSPWEKIVSPAPKLSFRVATLLKTNDILGGASILKLVRRFGFRFRQAIARCTDRVMRGFAISFFISSKLGTWNSACPAFMRPPFLELHGSQSYPVQFGTEWENDFYAACANRRIRHFGGSKHRHRAKRTKCDSFAPSPIVPCPNENGRSDGGTIIRCTLSTAHRSAA